MKLYTIQKSVRDLHTHYPDMTRRELAISCGCSPNTVYLALRGQRLPREAKIQTSGILTVRRSLIKKHNYELIQFVVPACALRAAGLQDAAKLAYRVEGATIVISIS